jgi:hypothetical protein
MLCISELAKTCSLLFDTNVSKESMYCEINGKMFSSLNKFLQDSCNFLSAVKVVEMKHVYDRIDKKHWNKL